MSNIHSFLYRLLLIACLVSSAFADTVTLKNGEHLEGTITNESDTEVTIQVKISAGITDERVIPKAQIAKTEKTSPEIEAYKAIAKIQLGTDSMTVTQYDPYIRALEAFMEQYPKSTQAIDVQKVLNAFTEEKKRVEAGQVKLDGTWLSKAEVQREKVQIGGQVAFSYMKSQISAGEYIPALNTFAAMEKSFPGAAVMPDAIDLAQKIVIQLETDVQQAIPNQKARVAEQKKNLVAEGPADRAVMTAAIKKEDEAGDAAVAAAASAGQWPPFLPRNEKSLTALVAKMKTEAPRLGNLPVAKMKQSVELALEAKRNLASADTEGAVEKLKEATELWPANELAQRLTKEAAQDQKTAAASAAAAAAATPIPAKATPQPRQIAPMAAADSTKSPSENAPEGTAKPVTHSTPLPASTPAASAANDDEPFFKSIAGKCVILVVLVGVLIGVNFVVKKRKAQQAG